MSKYSNNKSKENQQEEDCQYVNECGIIFTDMKEQHMTKVGLIACTPETIHRAITSGLNLQGMCLKQGCKVFKKMVWVKLGYGQFIINVAVNKAKCPICKVRLPSHTVTSLGYTKAIIKAEGKVEGQDDVKEWDPPSETEGKFIKFDGYDGATSKWEYLMITASKS